jgi:hypothetical protein
MNFIAQMEQIADFITEGNAVEMFCTTMSDVWLQSGNFADQQE